MRWLAGILTGFLLLPSMVFGETKKSKDWLWDASNPKAVWAGTVNDEGRVLGQYCRTDTGDCVYRVTLGLTCNAGSEYPTILNTESGVSAHTLICEQSGNNDSDGIFLIRPFDDVDAAIRESINAGFVIATESGRFKAVRFSLAGSTYAIEAMRAAARVYAQNYEKRRNKASTEEFL